MIEVNNIKKTYPSMRGTSASNLRTRSCRNPFIRWLCISKAMGTPTPTPSAAATIKNPQTTHIWRKSSSKPAYKKGREWRRRSTRRKRSRRGRWSHYWQEQERKGSLRVIPGQQIVPQKNMLIILILLPKLSSLLSRRSHRMSTRVCECDKNNWSRSVI